MALAVNGSGTIFKKCDRSNHRPDSNKRCASSECQHTCDHPERCSHAWTLRYWVNGKQVEKSFRDKQHPSTGRVDYGSGRKLARDWQLKVTVDKRSGDIAFTDHSKSGKQNFGEACELFIARLPVSDGSKRNYLGVYRAHVKPAFGDMTLTQVANDRDGVMDLLAVKMKHLGNTARQQARYVIVATLDEAVKAGRLSRHRLDGIELADHGRYSRKNFVFPSYEQVSIVADGGVNPETKRAVAGAGLCVWLMRGCGLRIEEALAVSREDFIEDGKVLRVAWQASRDGKRREPLKHRKAGEYRDVPVPSWLWEIELQAADGFCQDPLRAHVYQASSPPVVALRSQRVLTGSGSPVSSYGGLGEATHTCTRIPAVGTPGHEHQIRRSMLPVRLVRRTMGSGPGGPGLTLRHSLVGARP